MTYYLKIMITLMNYGFAIHNLGIIPINKFPGVFGDELNVDVDGESNHTKFTTDPYVQLYYRFLYKEQYRDKSLGGGIKGLFGGSGFKGELRSRTKVNEVYIGDPEKSQSGIVHFEAASEDYHNQEAIQMFFISMYVHSAMSTLINTTILLDKPLKDKYERVLYVINKFKQDFPQFGKTDYNRLSIWQPVPPPGYVALGFVFTNDEEDVKPSTQLIKCIPKSCVKSFKRRPWIPTEDVIFKYSDSTQNLVFYRNPFLGTVVVVDENKQKGVYKNKAPNAIKYRNEKDSLFWECFDIIPCVKECDYVDKLKDADKNAKQMCRAYRGVENQIYDKTESKQTLLAEEEKLNNLVNDKKKYIDNLLAKINGIMSEDELYKLITEGINRYKVKKDLEEQRQLHGKVADKLLQTRGIEFSWDVPDELSKFKDLLKDFMIAQYGRVSQQEQDCPVCKLPDTTGFVKMKDLELCYGCLEDVVRELVGKKKAAGQPIPPELEELQNKIQ